MRQTLFHIPLEIFGIPLFGFGLLLAVWAVVSLVLLGALVRRQGFNADTRSYLPVLGMFGLVILFLPKIADPGGLPIRSFGVMMLLGMVSGVWLAIQRARQMRLDPEIILSLAMWLFVFGIVGARAFYVIQKWPEFQRPTLPETFLATLNVTQGGLVVYGSVIAAGLGLFLFCRRNKLPMLALCDLIAPSMMIGLALGRIGCFLNGCCFGGVCDLPWAVTFPQGSPPHVRQVQEGKINLHGLYLAGDLESPPVIQEVTPNSPAAEQGLAVGQRIEKINGLTVSTVDEAQRWLSLTTAGPLSIQVSGDPRPKKWSVSPPLPRSRPVHPTQLYSALDAALICFLLWTYYPFRRRDGEVTALMLTVYAITRFLIEALRTDEPKNILGMTISQNISLLMLVLAIGLWFYLLRRPSGTEFGEPQAQAMQPLAV